jgi:hypothetical protein
MNFRPDRHDPLPLSLPSSRYALPMDLLGTFLNSYPFACMILRPESRAELVNHRVNRDKLQRLVNEKSHHEATG